MLRPRCIWVGVVSAHARLTLAVVPREGRPEKQRRDIDLLPLPAHQAQQHVDVLLENSQITDPVLDELGSDQRPTVVPLLPVRREDTVPEKVLPIFMKRLAFAIVLELSSQDGFDVLRLGGEDEALRTDLRLDRVRRPGRSKAGEEPFPELEVFVSDGGRDASIGEVEACRVREDSNMEHRRELVPSGRYIATLGARPPSAAIL